MLNMLVVDNDMPHCKRMVNCISEATSNVRLFNLVTSRKSALDAINVGAIDFVLLNLKDSNSYLLTILDSIPEKVAGKYFKTFIVLVDNEEQMKKIENNPYIHSIILKPCEPKLLIDTIQALYADKIDEDSMTIVKNKIIQQLIYLSYSFKFSGTKYLVETIYELYKRKNTFCDNLQKDIYPIIAKRYDKTIYNIKTNIDAATTAMGFDCNEKVMMAYFNYPDSCKPRVKETIYTVLNKIA